ncbi:MAG: hypothetical protein AB7D37_11235 [Desulfovibrio sp.]
MKQQIQVISKAHKGLLYVESLTPGGRGVLHGVKARIDGTPGKRKVVIKPEDVEAVRCQLVQ